MNTLCDLRTVLRDTLGVLHQQGTVFEIRIPKVRFRKQTASGYFDDPNAAATAALAFDGNAPALYVTINPVAPALLARAANRMQDYAEHTTADHDIVRRHWLPLDIDPVRPSGISSTDAEHNAAHALAQQIRDELRQDGWPDPVYGDSGNGASLLYAIDLPNTPDVTDLIKRTLAGLAQRFNTDLVQVDTSVFNAARIMKLYGTIVKKGDNTPDRPHRRSRLIDVPTHPARVPIEQLEVVALPPALHPARAQPIGTAQNRVDAYDVQAFLARNAIAISKTKTGADGGTTWELERCPWNDTHQGTAYVIQLANGAIKAGCHKANCGGNGQTNHWQELRAKYEPPTAHSTNSANDGPWSPPVDHIRAVGVEVPLLPAYAAVDDALAAQASPWLDAYITFSRQWSPESYDHFHEAIALWILSTVAARRVVLDYGGPLFTNLYICVCARTSLFAKSTAAGIGQQLLEANGLTFLLAPDDATPQAFLRSLTGRVPEGLAMADEARRVLITNKLAFAAQRGWFYDEFGQKLQAMMQSNGTMADFRGHLRRFDDCKPTYEYVTVGRGSDLIERPYLALLASMTPADLQPHARKGSALWGDGFLARFALVTPPQDMRMELQDFPDGERIIPASILRPLRAWHDRLGTPAVSMVERTNDKGERTGIFDAAIEPRPPERCTFGPGVRNAVKAYRRALREIMQGNTEHTDLDGNYARLHIKALRVAMLLASFENHGRIELRHWAGAQQIAERWRADLHHLVAQLADTEPSRERTMEDKMMAWLTRQDGWYTARVVAQYVRGLSSVEAHTCLERMAVAGVVGSRSSRTGKTVEYRAYRVAERRPGDGADVQTPPASVSTAARDIHQHDITGSPVTLSPKNDARSTASGDTHEDCLHVYTSPLSPPGVNGHKPRPSPELRGEVLLALSERRYADARTFMHERAAFNWLPEQEMLGVREGGVA